MAGSDAENVAFLAAIRVPNVESPEADILSLIPPDLQGKYWATHWVAGMAPFCELIAAEGCLNYG